MELLPDEKGEGMDEKNERECYPLHILSMAEARDLKLSVLIQGWGP